MENVKGRQMILDNMAALPTDGQTTGLYLSYDFDCYLIKSHVLR